MYRPGASTGRAWSTVFVRGILLCAFFWIGNASNDANLGRGLNHGPQLVAKGYGWNDVEHYHLTLDRNQYIGTLMYEDLLQEVEAIGSLVAQTFKKSYPAAEVTIMGSYHRRKETCV